MSNLQKNQSAETQYFSQRGGWVTVVDRVTITGDEEYTFSVGASTDEVGGDGGSPDGEMILEFDIIDADGSVAHTATIDVSNTNPSDTYPQTYTKEITVRKASGSGTTVLDPGEIYHTGVTNHKHSI